VKNGIRYRCRRLRAVFVLLAVSLAFMAILGCGRARILREANEVTTLAHDTIKQAEAIAALSARPDVTRHAKEIISNQTDIIGRATAIEHATVQVDDKSDNYLSWWGDFFMGGVDSMKWIAIAGLALVVAFVGFRARIWSLIGSFIPRRRQGEDG
jgi:predicted PurR-regulated permease PerM